MEAWCVGGSLTEGTGHHGALDRETFSWKRYGEEERRWINRETPMRPSPWKI
jgi:hypothetical protein